MGFPKSHATTILADVFKQGNTMALLTAVDTENDTYTEASGLGYARYTLKSGDFTWSMGVATTAQHILYGLAEGSWGNIVGFAIFGGGTLKYLAELKEAKNVSADKVPVFKKYNAATGDGIRVTLDVVTAASMSVTETT